MRQIWASEDDMWSEDDEINFLKRKMTNLSQLLDLSARLNSAGLFVGQGTQQSVCHANEIELNFTLGMSYTENKPNWENKFKYNPSHNPVTILKTDPNLVEVWNNVTKLHEKLADELSNNNHNSESSRTSGDNRTGNKVPGKNMKTTSVNLESKLTEFSGDTVTKEPAEGTTKPIQVTLEHLEEHPSISSGTSGKISVDDNKNPRKRNSIANMLNVSDTGAPDHQEALPESFNSNFAIEVTSDNSSVMSDREHLDRLEKGDDVKKEEVLSALLNFLPSRLETELLIQTFFKYLYPYLPFLDSKNIKIQFDRIFPFTSDIGQPLQQEPKLLKISLSNYNDYCNLGIIILIIKLTELSFDPAELHGSILDDTEIGERSIDPSSRLFKHRIPQSILEMVERDFVSIQGNMIGAYVTIPLIHFAILSRIYSESANDVDYLFASRCSLENIVQLALSFGLNIDPNNHELLTKLNDSSERVSVAPNIDRFKHVWRKTWYFIVSLDVNQSFDFGRTRLLKNLKQVSNTKLPIFSNVDYVKDIQELVVVKNFTLFYELDLIIISVLRFFEDIRRQHITKLKFDVVIGALVRLATGKATTKEALLTLDNLNILPEQEGWLRVLFVKDANEQYNLPNIDQLLDIKPSAMNLSELERKLEIPRKSMSISLFFVKHIVLRHLIFELCWKASSSFPPESMYGQFALYYAKEAYTWTADILNNIILFFNEAIESSGMATRIITPPLLQPLFASLQYLTSLVLKRSPIFENAGIVLLHSITALLEKIAKYNKRSEIIFEFISKFNTLYPHDKYLLSNREYKPTRKDASIAVVHSQPDVGHAVQGQIYAPQASVLAPPYQGTVQQQYLPNNNTQVPGVPVAVYPSYASLPYSGPIYVNPTGPPVYNSGQIVTYPAVYYSPGNQQQFNIQQDPNQYITPYQVVTFSPNTGIQYVQQGQPFIPPNAQQNHNTGGTDNQGPPENYQGYRDSA